MTLWRALERGDDVAVSRACAALRSGLLALRRIHSLGLVLGVSHANFCFGGRWKVCGAHLARPLSELEQERDLLGHRLLPEVLFELPLTERLDLWLLGCSSA